ncbi:UDP-galactopyranose mutase [bacterium SCSIO 12741]|nr:UDP-galactopyranose mutase [bacterium SCSIO 12741]
MEWDKVDYLVVGAGFFGSVIAERIANDLNRPVTVIDKRPHIGGNCYSKIDEQTGIEVHEYGTHIFHTDNEKVWNYIQGFTGFNSYRHQVLTTFQDRVYQMPINLETINSFYNVNLKPFEVDDFLAQEIAKEPIDNPTNFEEMALSMIGRPLYEAFIKGYTLKQWQKHPKDLPASILKRLPFRRNYDESYFHSTWQGIPTDGYTAIFEKMLNHPNIDLQLNTDFFDIRDQIGEHTLIIYSGPIDRFFDYRYGKLDWRSLRFESEVVKVQDYQGTSVMNYAEESVPYTRIHEPKHLHTERPVYQNEESLIIREYSLMDDGSAPYYPINDERNQKLILQYREEVNKLNKVLISGRLGDYKYYDMHQTIAAALETYEQKIKG